jgi:hypothetical protein
MTLALGALRAEMQKGHAEILATLERIALQVKALPTIAPANPAGRRRAQVGNLPHLTGPASPDP